MKERKVELFVQLFCRVQTTIWRKKEKIKKGSTRFFDWVVKETRIGNGFSQPAISFQMNFWFFVCVSEIVLVIMKERQRTVVVVSCESPEEGGC